MVEHDRTKVQQKSKKCPKPDLNQRPSDFFNPQIVHRVLDGVSTTSQTLLPLSHQGCCQTG